MDPIYIQANSRPDLSDYVVHLTRDIYLSQSAPQGLVNILLEGVVRPSQAAYVTRFCPDGAACFYEVPPSLWPQLVCSNPSNRQPFGIIIEKKALWRIGGRPVIYTENSDPAMWPEGERYRLCHTDLSRQPHPIDWMHEREWRIRGGLSLATPGLLRCWWPLVPNLEWLNWLVTTTQRDYVVYVLSEGIVYQKANN